MSDHHQLGAFLSSYPDLELEVSTGPYGVADDIIDELRKLGWRKPRIITTAEELDALAPWAVIRDACEDVWEKWVDVYKVDSSVWVTPGVEERKSGVFVPMLPATVLHEGVRDE